MQSNLSKQISPLKILMFYAVTGWLVFGWVVNNTFAADDYRTIYSLYHKGFQFHQGFFRPLADLTFLWDLHWFGFQPVGFHLTNVTIHVSCSWLVYILANRYADLFHLDGSREVSVLAGLFFLIYPFHSEPVVWISARNSSIATGLALIALILAISNRPFVFRFVLAIFAYSLAIIAYESVMALPAIICVSVWLHTRQRKQVAFWFLGLSMAVLLHFGLRLYFSGSYHGGAYAGFIIGQEIITLAKNSFRVMSRLITPPIHSGPLFLGCFLFLATGFFFLFKRLMSKDAVAYRFSKLLMALLVVSCLVAITFPVSTKTSETDRLLYFPSVFVCMQLALLSRNFPSANRWVYILLLISLQLFLTGRQVMYWERASSQMEGILSALVRSARAGKQVLLVNLPEEVEGAFMLPGVLDEALYMRGGLPGQVVMVNYLDPAALYAIKSRIYPKMMNGRLFIPPVTTVHRVPTGMEVRTTGGFFRIQGKAEIWYWNGEETRKIVF